MKLTSLIPDPKKFDLDNIESVYTGRVGCMCGCMGNHTENRNSFRYVLNKVCELDGEVDLYGDNEANASAVRGDRWSVNPPRQYVVYFKPGVIQGLMADYEVRRAVMGGAIGISDARAVAAMAAV
jgi:hypothetical protein